VSNGPRPDKSYGDRAGSVLDPFGQRWSIMTHKEDVSPEEMQRRMAKIGGEARRSRASLDHPCGDRRIARERAAPGSIGIGRSCFQKGLTKQRLPT
jgi:hypothetical protein